MNLMNLKEHTTCFTGGRPKDDPNNMWLMEQFWNVTDVDEKDKMVASVVLRIHPEIDYKKLYPCLQQDDLSPKTIFGRDIPDVPVIEYNGASQKLTVQLQQTDMSLRIDKSDDLHRKVLQSEDKIECMSSKTNEELRKDLIVVKNNEKSHQLE